MRDTSQQNGSFNFITPSAAIDQIRVPRVNIIMITKVDCSIFLDRGLKYYLFSCLHTSKCGASGTYNTGDCKANTQRNIPLLARKTSDNGDTHGAAICSIGKSPNNKVQNKVRISPG